MVVESQDCTDGFRITGFYGAPRVSEIQTSWSILKALKDRMDMACVCGGDFNETTKNSEKSRGVERNEQQMALFREALDFCKLENLGCMGPKFTWIGQRAGGVTIKCRLDRIVANERWQEYFPNSTVKAQNGPLSDHCSLILDSKRARTCQKKKRIQRFESMWFCHPRFQEQVTHILEEGTRHYQNNVHQQIKHMQGSLANWNRNEFRNVDNVMRRLQD